MVKMIMGVGIPGSGKTTALKPLAERYSYKYISPDDVRAELTGTATDQSKNKEVWEEVYTRVAKELESGETVVFDATFARENERKDFIKFAREHGAEKVQGIFASVPLEVADERNNSRERVVPRYAMERMDKMIQEHPPEIEDGFDSIFEINEFQELENVERATEQGKEFREFGGMK